MISFLSARKHRKLVAMATKQLESEQLLCLNDKKYGDYAIFYFTGLSKDKVISQRFTRLIISVSFKPIFGKHQQNQNLTF